MFSSTFSRTLQAVCNSHSFTDTTSENTMCLNPIAMLFNGAGGNLSNPPSSSSFGFRTAHLEIFFSLSPALDIYP